MNQTENPPPLPLPESYWIEPGSFLAGEHPFNRDLRHPVQALADLLAAGLDTFIDLTTPGEFDSYQSSLDEATILQRCSATYQRFPIGDYGVPFPETMLAILDAIDTALAGGHKVYMHCWGGIGRTGTVTGCYLVRHGMTGSDALITLAEWWRTVPKSVRFPHSPETRDQRQFILDWGRSQTRRR
jgi:Cyclin-dependent kinase inhibitor 3 (CDKN3)